MCYWLLIFYIVHLHDVFAIYTWKFIFNFDRIYLISKQNDKNLEMVWQKR